MSRLPEYRIELKRTGSIEAPLKIDGPSDVARIVREMHPNADREYLVVLCMDITGKCRGLNTVSVGTLNSSLAHPREIFKAAILTNAANIILAHNHPSDDTTPSSEDVNVSRRVKAAGDILGIGLLDHVVVGQFGHTSLGERGLI